jgi:hypothetical protein
VTALSTIKPKIITARKRNTIRQTQSSAGRKTLDIPPPRVLFELFEIFRCFYGAEEAKRPRGVLFTCEYTHAGQL